MNNEKRQNQLKGRENYLPWLTRLEGLLTLDDVLTRDATDTLVIIGATDAAKAVNEKKALKYVIQNCDDSVMHSINPTDPFSAVIDKLNAAYGFGNIDPSIILTQLREIRFHPSKDPSILLNEIDKKLAELISAGGSITDAQMVQYIHDGLSGDPLRDSFWFNCKGAMNMAKLSTFTVETAGKYIVRFWYSYKPNKVAETANYGKEQKKPFEKRFCQHCKDEKRERIMKTHNSKDCRMHRDEKKVEEGNEATDTLDNKESSNYSSELFHDSGTSKTMLNYRTVQTTEDNLSVKIHTAGANQKPQFATSKGLLNLGPICVEALHVPTFSKNLLSATQLSIEHGCKQVIDPWTAKLTITKEDEIVATGSYDKETKLIKIDRTNESALKASTDNNWMQVHRRMGHVGSDMLRKTLKASTGIKLGNKFEVLSCEDCKISKAKRNAIPSSKEENSHEILDVIEVDVQGPFPIVANDGTCSNLKMIDSKSSFLYYATVPDTKANTILDEFIKFKVRIEKQTGLAIKRVRSDQGNEFMGEFLSFRVL